MSKVKTTINYGSAANEKKRQFGFWECMGMIGIMIALFWIIMSMYVNWQYAIG